jgi:hypothetical protein
MAMATSVALVQQENDAGDISVYSIRGEGPGNQEQSEDQGERSCED